MGKFLLFGFHSVLAGGIFFVLTGFFLLINSADLSLFFYFFAIFIFLFLFGVIIGAIDFLLIFLSRRPRRLKIHAFNNPKVIVGMTAYNDEGVIGKAVQDFKSNPLVSKVIVVDNNSIDKTF
ncbi:MAG: hypothetical protein ABIA76_02025, partial [Candidatus Diapherotrites archaeon]